MTTADHQSDELSESIGRWIDFYVGIHELKWQSDARERQADFEIKVARRKARFTGDTVYRKCPPINYEFSEKAKRELKKIF